MRHFLKAITQRYLDLHFRASGGLKVQIAEYPGRWMDDRSLERLCTELREIARTSLEAGDLGYGVFSGDKERLDQTIVTLVKDRSGAPIAFNALAVIETELNGQVIEVLHLGLVMVDPAQRSKGLSWILYGLTCVLLLLRNGLRPVYVSNVTQVPAIVGLVSETFSNVFPTPQRNENSDFNKLLLARAIVAEHRHVFGVGDDARFDDQHFVIRNAYTGGSDHLKKTFEQAAKHRVDAYNSYCQTILNYERGDDFLQIGQIDLSAASRYVSRQVPKGSVVSLLAIGIIVALRRTILPALYWFESGKAFGSLRPAK